MSKYLLSNLQDGEVPGWSTVPDNYQPASGEVVLSEADFHDGWVWDATNQRLREPVAADALRFARRAKRSEMEHAFANNMEQIIPIWLALARIAKNLAGSDPRFAKVSSGHDQLQTIYTQLQAKTTPEDVNAIMWNQVT